MTTFSGGVRNNYKAPNLLEEIRYTDDFTDKSTLSALMELPILYTGHMLHVSVKVHL